MLSKDYLQDFSISVILELISRTNAKVVNRIYADLHISRTDNFLCTRFGTAADINIMPLAVYKSI